MLDSSLMKKISECNWHRVAVSFWSSVAFIGWGGTLVVIGPTLLDLAHHVSVSVSIVSLMFICRAVGSFCGVFMLGAVLDKLKGYLYTIVFTVVLLFGATSAVIPLSVNIVMLSVFMVLSGMMSGCTITSIQYTSTTLWGDKSGPVNQFLYFCFALGAFISPLIAKPFISNDASDLVNSTCRLSNQSAFVLNPDDINLSDCSISQNCSSRSNETEASSNFAFAYWSILSILIPPTIAFLYFAVRYDLIKKCICRDKNVSGTTESTVIDSESKTAEKTEKPFVKQSLCYRIIILALLSSFLLVYVGAEATFGSLIFTVAVTGELCFTKSSAAILQSVFWGTFAFMRLFSVSLALLKVRSSVMLVGNLSGSLLASIIMVFYPHNTIAIWIGSALLGTSYSSVFPNTMTWKSENIHTSGISTAVVMCGAVLGVMSMPSIVGALIDHVTPDSLIYFTFICVLLSCGLVAALFIIASVSNRRSSTDSTSQSKNKIRYERLQNQDQEMTSV